MGIILREDIAAMGIKKAELRAVIIRADGRREDLGVIASTDDTFQELAKLAPDCYPSKPSKG